MIPNKLLINNLFLLTILLFSCKKSESETPQPTPTPDNEPQLVESLNGYRFEGRFSEDDPNRFGFPEVRTMDEYNDSLRLHFTTLSEPGVTPAGYKWYVVNAFHGKTTRIYKPLDVPMQKDRTFRYTWNHPANEFAAYNNQESYANFYHFKNPRRGFFVNKPNNTFPFIFTRNFTVFFESQQSVYLFEHNSLTTLNRFLLSNEPSIVVTDTYLDPDFDYNGYFYRANFITAFFNPTLFGNYIGMARGDQTIDTMMLNHYNPTIYTNSGSDVFVDKVGDTLVMGLIKRRTANVEDGQDLSLYRILPGENELKPVFENLNVLPQNTGANFHKGHFYLDGKRLSDAGVWQEVPMPKMKAGYSASVLQYGRKRMYLLANKDKYSFEIYSRSY